jgi:hypothetical protein
LRLILAGRPQGGAPDLLRILGEQPCLDVGEQLLTRGLTKDEPPTRSLARDAGDELAIE